MKNEEILKVVIKACDDLEATDIEVIDLMGVSSIVDYFVVCHANNERKLVAIAEAVKKAANENNITIQNFEGKFGSDWVLVDLIDIVVHIFNEEQRDNYQLEKLFGEVPRIDINKILEKSI